MKVPIGRYWKMLSKYMWSQWKQVILLVMLMATSVGLRLWNPQIIRSFIDEAIAGVGLQRLISLAGLFTGIAIVQQLMIIGTTYVSQLVGWKATNTLRTDLVSHCLQLDQSFHKAHRPGELIERMDGDVTALFNFFSRMLVNLINNLALILGVLVLLFIEDWRIGMGLTLFVILSVWVMIKIQSIAVSHWVNLKAIAAKFFGFLGEQIASTEDVRANGAIGHVMRQFYEYIRNWLPLERKAKMLLYTNWMSTILIFAMGNAVALGISGYLWVKGFITIGTIYLVFNYTEMLRQPLEQIRVQLEDLQHAGASIVRIEELFSIQSSLAKGGQQRLPEGALAVEVKELSFEYDAGLPVLHNIDFRLVPGTILGVLGRTGSGKTTLARLLVRFYDPTSGEICLGTQPTTAVPLKHLRERIAFVTQDVQLFQGTVRDNLTFFNPAISDDQILAAFSEIGLSDWCQTLPAGLDTMLEAEGAGLSAGEAQLLVLVRVFLKNPGLVILDEASSRLDPYTELLLEGAISKLLSGRTAIIIAHRLRTIQRADEILILDQGQILENGKQDVLANDPQSRFYQLLQTGLEEVLA